LFERRNAIASLTHPSQGLDGWTIVFDLDGTLVESAPDLLVALNHVVSGHGVEPVRLEEIRTMIGHGAKAMIRHALASNQRPVEDGEIDRMWREFLDFYSANIAVQSYVFEGVTTALDELSQRGARLSVCTNKTQALSDQLLEELELRGRFQAIVGADAVPSKKPDGGHVTAAVERAGGRMDKSIMVGDSRTDEKAALNAGLPFIFVPFGYEAAPVEDIRCSSVLHHYSELVERVLGLAS